MKVLHVVNISFVLPYYIGDQFDYFIDKGVEFHVACSPSDFLTEYSKRKKIKAHPIDVLREISPLKDVISIYKLIKVIKSEKIDIVIGHTPKGGLLAMIASSIVGVQKRIYFRHGLMYETSSGLKRKILIGIEKFTGRLATKIVCVSPSVLKVSNTVGLSNPKKNILLNKGTCNGIDVEKFTRSKILDKHTLALKNRYHIKDNDKVVGYVGRLVNDKGISELIESWKILLEKYDNIKLLLIGPFEERDSLSDEVKDFIANTPSIIHTGLVEDVFSFYALMDMFILPSHREGFPTVVLEASAMELPVITTMATGCIDSIEVNRTGVFITNKPEDIANKISFYLENPIIGVEHGKNGRINVVKEYEQEKIWKEIEDNVLEL